MENKLRPDFLVGDLDSIKYDDILTEAAVKAAIGEIPHEVVPVEKDDTDMGLAVAKAYEKGYHEILIYGGCGGARVLSLIHICMSIIRQTIHGIHIG